MREPNMQNRLFLAVYFIPFAGLGLFHLDIKEVMPSFLTVVVGDAIVAHAAGSLPWYKVLEYLAVGTTLCKKL